MHAQILLVHPTAREENIFDVHAGGFVIVMHEVGLTFRYDFVVEQNLQEFLFSRVEIALFSRDH